MKIVYIAHPISGNIQRNLELVRLIVRHLNLTDSSILPFAPYWLDCHALNDNNPVERDRGILNDKVLLPLCNELWVYGDYIKSRGCQAEIVLARFCKIEIKIKDYPPCCLPLLKLI